MLTAETLKLLVFCEKDKDFSFENEDPSKALLNVSPPFVVRDEAETETVFENIFSFLVFVFEEAEKNGD